MNPSTYVRVTLKNCLREQEEEITAFCFDYGALGVSEALKFEQNDPANYQPLTIFTDVFSLEVFFQTHPGDIFYQEIYKKFQISDYEEHLEQEKDWLEEWKKGYEPFEIVQDIWIVPSWCTAPLNAKKIIWMEPGMAFGTGTHETTQLVAELLSSAPIETSDNMLDVGTGSGVLAILAAHLGINNIVGIDIDKESLRVAKDNVLKNSVQEFVDISIKDVSELSDQYTWVVANIIDGVLLKIKLDLLKVLKPGGYLVLSGILEERWPAFKKEFIETENLKIIECKQKGDWIGVLLNA
ncbi:MAG: 50S ribosomal protein L11 methyltransferase [Bdellovibrionales bacterium]|nr:50S ribosomal protein L11 methyltransferase [Bdellovibrionales bacterium]